MGLRALRSPAVSEEKCRERTENICMMTAARRDKNLWFLS